MRGSDSSVFSFPQCVDVWKFQVLLKHCSRDQLLLWYAKLYSDIVIRIEYAKRLRIAWTTSFRLDVYVILQILPLIAMWSTVDSGVYDYNVSKLSQYYSGSVYLRKWKRSSSILIFSLWIIRVIEKLTNVDGYSLHSKLQSVWALRPIVDGCRANWPSI